MLGAPVTIDVALAPAGRITGALTDPGGRPLDFPLIFVWDDSDPRQVIFHVTPDELTGAYDMGGLPSGNFYLQFTGRQGLDSYVGYYDGAATLEEATPISVLVGQTTAGIDGELGLPPGGVIKGGCELRRFVGRYRIRRDLRPLGRRFRVGLARALVRERGRATLNMTR